MQKIRAAFNHFLTRVLFLKLTFLLAVWPCHASQKIPLRISIISKLESPKGKACLKFKELLDRYTQNGFEVEFASDRKLFGDREEIEALRLNAVQMIVPAVSKLGLLGISEFEVLDIPFLFDDNSHVRQNLDGLLGQGLLSKLEPKGMKGLAFWDMGFKGFHSKKQIRKASDLIGLNFSTIKNRTLISQAKTLGVNPFFGQGNIYSNLIKDGSVEAGEAPLANYLNDSIYLYQRNFTVTNHGFYGYIVLVNSEFWKSLTDKLRASFERALREATQYERSLVDTENAKIISVFEEKKTASILRLTEKERADFKKALEPVRADFIRQHGPDLLKDLAPK